jgi:hypothetical protein
LATRARLERATYCLEGSCSIRVSYRVALKQRIIISLKKPKNQLDQVFFVKSIERKALAKLNFYRFLSIVKT